MMNISELFKKEGASSEDQKRELLWKIFEEDPNGQYSIINHPSFDDFFVGKCDIATTQLLELIISSHPSQQTIVSKKLRLLKQDIILKEFEEYMDNYDEPIPENNLKAFVDDALGLRPK